MGLYIELTKKIESCVCRLGMTHNLNHMAGQAGIYEAIWRPDEIGVSLAGGLIEHLSEGLVKLKKDPEYFKQFDDSNGWGTYEDFVPWVERYLEACCKHPDARISIER